MAQPCRRRLVRGLIGLVFGAALTCPAYADPLHDAAATGNIDQIRRLLKEDPKRLEKRSVDDRTPLLYAVTAGQMAAASFLLEQGANSNASNGVGDTALFDAVYRGDAGLLRLLIRWKSSVNAKNHKGETPLHYAATFDKPDMARLLLGSGADPNLRQQEGKTPLLYAVEADHAALVPILLAANADPLLPDNSAVSPVMLAITRLGKTGDGAARALCGTLPVNLHLAGTSLRDAFSQLFTQIKATADLPAGLDSPVTLNLATDLAAALRNLLRQSRTLSGQSLAFTITKGRIQVVAEGIASAAAPDEVWPVITADSRLRFGKVISRPVLGRYLTRSVAHFGLLASSPEPSVPNFAEDLRMLTHMGAKLVANSAYAWTPPDDDIAHFRQAADRARRVHQADPEIVLQGCIFEAISRPADRIQVPDWVFAEYDMPRERRNFSYDAMLYSGGRFHNHWAADASIPDMSKPETQMWFYYRARSYIDAGCEAVHFGQVELMHQADPGHTHWRNLLHRVRRYASRYARRGAVLCDANTHGLAENGILLFDYHSWPLRPAESPASPSTEQCEMRTQFEDSIILHSLGGISPNGWTCDSLPYTVGFDNCGVKNPGQGGLGAPWVWGYDEISWFAHQSEARRNAFLRYAARWVQEVDPAGCLQPSTRKILAAPVNGTDMYQANRSSDACPMGFNQEDTIRELFAL